jgi:hypothetical protein
LETDEIKATLEEGLAIARQVLFETPQSLSGMVPR